MVKKGPKFYAVANGFTPGVYTTWEECSAQTQGYSNAKYKSFATKKEAEKYLAENKDLSPPPKKSKQQQFPNQFQDSENQSPYTNLRTTPIQYSYHTGVSIPLGVTKEPTSTYTTYGASPYTQQPPINLTPVPTNLAPAPDFISVALDEPPPKPEPPLGPEQQQVLDMVLRGESVFFTGSAGTGKSFLLERITKGLRNQQKIVALTAATGIAAVNIGGTTLHKWAGIGIGVPDELQGIDREKAFTEVKGRAYKNKKAWRDTSALIIDEISMISGYLFDDLDAIAREIRGRDVPFGGLQLILCGDFLQIPPVSRKNSVRKLTFEGSSWNQCNLAHILLRSIYRQSDSEFVSILNAARTGKMTAQMVAKLRGCQRDLPVDNGIQPTKVFATNDMVDQINSQKLDELNAPLTEFEASDFTRFGKLKPEEKKRYASTFDSFMASPMLQLKKGAQVMLIRNIDDHLVNGSRGVVTGFRLKDLIIDRQHYFENCYYVTEWAKNVHEKFCITGKSKRKWEDIVQRFSSGKQEGVIVQVCLPVVQFQGGREMVIKPVAFTSETFSEKFVRVQLPLKLAWALTIHKCQGLTLDKVEITFQGMFEYGQAYVALSRARTLEGLKLNGFDPQYIKTDPKVLRFYETMDSSLDDM